MALSDDEQRTLAQLEADLAADGPTFVGPTSTLSRRPRYRLNRRRTGLAFAGLILGLALVVVGVSTFFLISIAGYLLMLASALQLRGAASRVDTADGDHMATPHPRIAQQDFVRLMERQWGLREHDDH